MQIKTVKITNPSNVLIQVPCFVASQWQVQLGDELEVHYDGDTDEVTIRKAIRRRVKATV